MKGFDRDGFCVLRKIFAVDELERMRVVADRLAEEAGKACVRNICELEAELADLASSAKLTSLLPNGYTMVRSILFDKTSEQNWPVAWHQDLTIAMKEKFELTEYGPWSQKDGVDHVQPPTAVLQNMATLRIHLDPTPASNGALRVIRSSHALGKLEQAKVASFVECGDEVTCECEPGDVLLMRPLLLHASSRSSAPSRRRVLHFEYALKGSLSSSLAWYEE